MGRETSSRHSPHRGWTAGFRTIGSSTNRRTSEFLLRRRPTNCQTMVGLAVGLESIEATIHSAHFR
jgi:hypothetical protein